MDTENTFGQMEEFIKVSGKKIRCMEKVHFFGRMEKSIKDNILMIKSMDMVNFIMVN